MITRIGLTQFSGHNHTMKRIELTIGISLAALAVLFNLWLYRLEPTALVDPNDNTFQYALVDRTNQIWNFAAKNCSGFILTRPICQVSYLVDHWVPNWAQGYNLPTYYSHIPQILIVASYRFLSAIGIPLGLFAYYHWMIYILLALFPFSVFLALRIIRLSPVIAGVGATLASHLSTDGLYGLDPPSFLWRGYGLSSQLFAMLFLPIALAYTWRVLQAEHTRKDIIAAILTLAAVVAGHLGIGMITILSVSLLAAAEPLRLLLLQAQASAVVRTIRINTLKLGLVAGGAVLLLSYWILPTVLESAYHNISIWDPIWKFDSYGVKEVMTKLLNGDLFDFGRLPVLTILVGIGLFRALLGPSSYFPFALLFMGMLGLYFGRITWGPLVDLIPGMKEFHLSRFIVGVHLAGLFLIPLGIEAIAIGVRRITVLVVSKKQTGYLAHPLFILALPLVLFLVVVPFVYKQTITYSRFNDQLILKANANYLKAAGDLNTLFTTLKDLQEKNPGRVFAGRGGSWGREFRVAETPYYMHLSTYGIPTVLWLPQTWSPNSDVEQYFSEDNPNHYALMNVRYVVAPPTQAAQPFWKFISETASWKLYEVETQGYIAAGIRPAVVASSKEDYKNVVRLWMHGTAYTQGIYPQLTHETGTYPKATGLPNFRMIDEVSYQVPDGSLHNLFAEPPLYIAPSSVRPSIVSQSQDTDMIFRATVEVPQGCVECIIVLRQTYHPGWRATIDGERVEPFTVFPFYEAISISAGTHEVVFSYQPPTLKRILLIISLLSALAILWQARHNSPYKIKV